jgi:hypothetical protein
MYSSRGVKKGLQNPSLVYSELCRPLLQLWTRLNRGVLERGLHVMEQDWDTLVILDGCRYDTFAKLNTIEGKLSSVVSGGSSSPRFMEHNFSGRTFPDTVYVSANPYLVRQGLSENFHRDIELWRDGWDAELRTVTPEVVSDAAIDAHREHPNKRLIVHYMQPHYPFIGPTGQKIEQAGILDDSDAHRIWDQLRHGEVDRELAVRAYEENLELALPHVERLISSVGGKSVVTADHGNSFGRFGVYGHPHETFISDLVEVPWLEVPGERRTVTAGDDCSRRNSPSEDTVSERLADLGYRDT